MKRPVMRDLYAVAVAFLGPHCVNGGADIWLRASLVWKATVVAPGVPHQRKPALAKSLFWSYVLSEVWVQDVFKAS